MEKTWIHYKTEADLRSMWAKKADEGKADDKRLAGRVKGSMHFRTGGDGRLTQLSRYERDTMVFVCRNGNTPSNPLFGKTFQF